MPSPISVQFSSVTQSCLTLCNSMNNSKPGLPVHHQLPEFTQTHVHQVGDAIQPSHSLLSLSPLAASGSFPTSQLFAWGGQSIGVSALASVLPMNTQDWSPLGWTDWLDFLAVQGTLRSLLQHHSSKASIFWCSAFFTVQLSHPYMTLATSSFLWFMDLTSQVPKQDSSIHYLNLFSPPNSHNWASFLLWLCLFILSGVISCSSSIVYWTPTDLGRLICCHIILPFHAVHGVLKTWMLKWFAIHLSYTDTTTFIFKVIQVLIIVFLFNHHLLKIYFGRSWHFLLIWKNDFPVLLGFLQPIISSHGLFF